MNTANTLRVALVTGGLAAGCAQMQRYPAPTPQVFTQAQSNIELASKKVSSDDEYATQHLQLARNQMAEAESAMSSGQTDRAALLVVRAEADAELAAKLADKGKVTREAERAERETGGPGAGAAVPAAADPAAPPAAPLPATGAAQ